MLGFRQAIFPVEEYVSDWVVYVKKGLNSLYVYCPLVESKMVGDAMCFSSRWGILLAEE
jgi:hypothetical protein